LWRRFLLTDTIQLMASSRLPGTPRPRNPLTDMRSRLVLLAALILAVQAPGYTRPPVAAAASSCGPTIVGGVLATNATWTASCNPYLVASTVQIQQGVTLTIEPGVLIQAGSINTMFVNHGVISALGTNANRIVFDGQGHTSSFFSAKSAPQSAHVNLDYVVVRDGGSLWPATGFSQPALLTLRHSLIQNLNGWSYLWYPPADEYIEYNTFINAAGFSVGHSWPNKFYFTSNRFVSRHPSAPQYWVESWNQTAEVHQNSFENAGQMALKLKSGYSSGGIDGTQNYWGTSDESVIGAMIFDDNDDITTPGFIPFKPYLSSPSSTLLPLLQLSTGGQGSGSIAGAPLPGGCSNCRVPMDLDSVVSLTATADAGSRFVGWSGACTGTGTCQVTMDDSKAVTALFGLTHQLSTSISGSGGGTVTSSPVGIDCGTDCSEVYDTGTVVTLTATPNATSTFAGWSGGGCSGMGTCQVTMDGAKSVTGEFAASSLAVLRTGSGGGTVTSSPVGIDCGTDCSEVYDTGTVVTLTATPNATSTFAGWSGGGCSGMGTCQVTMDGAKTVTATLNLVPPPPPPQAKSLTVRAKPKKVEAGRRTKLTALIDPCSANTQGDAIDLYRGTRKIGSKVANSECKAVFKVKMKKTAKFKVSSPADADSLAAASGTVRVRVV
jgi:hypothetical protein